MPNQPFEGNDTSLSLVSDEIHSSPFSPRFSPSSSSLFFLLSSHPLFLLPSHPLSSFLLLSPSTPLLLSPHFLREMAENSPYLEAIKEKEAEVLFCYEQYDDLTMLQLGEFEKKSLKSLENAVQVRAAFIHFFHCISKRYSFRSLFHSVDNFISFIVSFR